MLLVCPLCVTENKKSHGPWFKKTRARRREKKRKAKTQYGDNAPPAPNSANKKAENNPKTKNIKK
jgi:hypothetical protein